MKRTIRSLLVAASLLSPFAALASPHAASAPPPPARRGGHYELQSQRSWVPGHYSRMWVAHSRHHRGHYVTRWVPGFYQIEQAWVWVPVHHRGRVYVSSVY